MEQVLTKTYPTQRRRTFSFQGSFSQQELGSKGFVRHHSPRRYPQSYDNITLLTLTVVSREHNYRQLRSLQHTPTIIDPMHTTLTESLDTSALRNFQLNSTFSPT